MLKNYNIKGYWQDVESSTQQGVVSSSSPIVIVLMNTIPNPMGSLTFSGASYGKEGT